MVIDRWRQIESLFLAAHDKTAAERVRFLDEACSDESLRREVESLLAVENSASGFLESDSASGAPQPDTGGPVPPGEHIGPYIMLELLGAGGMGQVYKAYDERLRRHVAIKFLAAATAGDSSVEERFKREAHAASALNHPNICTVHDVGEFQGRRFIVMELLEGRSLRERIAGEPIPLPEFAAIARQICAGLAAAHAKGIVHRDVKPANIFVTRSGHVKILDFGLAKRGGESLRTPATALRLAEGTRTHSLSASGTITGTLGYMSPEHVLGEVVDARSDIFSLGVVLYEMATRQSPFRGKTAAGILGSILTELAPKPSALNAAIPAPLDRMILKALEKDREARYPSVAPLSEELEKWQESEGAGAMQSLLGKRRIVIPALLLLAAALAAATWSGILSRRMSWARNEALPEIARLVAKEDFDGAFRLALEAERYIPRDPELVRLQYHCQIRQSVITDPPGADVYVKGYLNIGANWIHLGKSPIERVRIPRGHDRWKITKDGFQPVEGAFSSYTGLPLPVFKLQPAASVPHGMVRVPGGRTNVYRHRPVELADYWIDKYETSNQQFQEFVERGGYQKREYWKHRFVQDGKVLSWERAMAAFIDATGRPGPSAWRQGTYPEGQGDFPVHGVSWYEAAAYAEYAGKSLPTYHQWRRAAGNLWFSDILRLSNFSGSGPVAVGRLQGLSPYGGYDMAGNVREWCWNQAELDSQERRYILGGSWTAATYIFANDVVASTFDRTAFNGFRCVRNTTPPGDALLGRLGAPTRDYSQEKPVSDSVFRVYRGFYSYDHTDLKASVESVDDSPRYWRRETITFNAAYGNERAIAHLFLPKGWAPPYQTVIYFPGSGSQVARSSDELEIMVIDFLLRSGRAVLYPVYKGMYERRFAPARSGPGFEREKKLAWSKDFSRSLDYIETRPDIDRQKLAFFGFSLGGIFGPVLTAIDGRMKASILLAGGFLIGKEPPETDPLHFAPRAMEPTLMISGRYDYQMPLENCQMPMLRLLGAPAKDKRIVLVESGHVVFPTAPVVKASLEWLDRYLGPVKIQEQAIR